MDSERESRILRASSAGIAVNLLLGVLKVVFGLIAGSVALVSDAVNNITDSSSSLITIIGTKLAGRDATQKHPFGFGRIEYLTSMIIGIIVTITGIETFISAVKGIIEPGEVDYSAATVIVIIATMAAKIVLGFYTERVGRQVNSDALKASGADSKNDALISLVTLISAFIFLFTGFSIDGWAGAFIAIFVIKTGIEVLKDTLSKILGEKADSELAEGIYNEARSIEGLGDPHDLVIHAYGPSVMTGSVNIELDADKTIEEVYPLVRKLQMRVYEKYSVALSVGFYAVNSSAPSAMRLTSILESEKGKHSEEIAGFHGVFADDVNKYITFDLTIRFGFDRRKICDEVAADVKSEFPDYLISANIDSIFSDGEYPDRK